ncbi:MAG: hypothetical protein IIX42_01125, partial [Alistipes sp.]|nr:hypothetical protein [Alistipes sp.]
LIALFAISCGGDNEEMPWDDDINPDKDEQTTVEIGKPLPIWSEGCLDIHFINTGRGECCFYILPDGTTLLVDAGEVKATYKASATSGDDAVEQKPNANTRPYLVYATYIKHFMPKGRSAINYCAPSHFHIDHIGSTNMATETAAAGYKKAGLTALYDEIPYLNVLDRAYPDYPMNNNHASVPEMDGQMREDWKKFVNWGEKEGKFKAARFTPGEEQIVLVYDKDSYSNCRIFNVCANGFVWSQSGITGSKSAKGNPASCGFHITYGKFDYMACGDLTSAPQNLAGNYVRDFIGASKLDAFKAHHHLSANSWGSSMQKEYFDPRVIVNQNFYIKQPDATLVNNIVGNVYASTRLITDFFTTNLHPYYISTNKSAVDNMEGYNGHIVIRVQPGGGEYNVYMLDDTDYLFKVKSIHGPYTSK